jgi:8-oxo-dGTP diphosphatase
MGKTNKQREKPGKHEKQTKKPMHWDDYPRPSVAVDVVVLTVHAGALYVALYERAGDDAADERLATQYALPGGFIRLDESLDDAARRVLRDKGGFVDDRALIEQLYTFGSVGRDTRGRVIAVAYVALLAPAHFFASTSTKARVRVPWAGETGGPVDVDVVAFDEAPGGGSAERLIRRDVDIAFDHRDIIGLAVKRLRGKLDYSPIGFQLLPAAFTLRQLQDVHEAVRGEDVNKDSFRRRMLASGQLEATGDHERDVTWRPAELYRFVRRSAV